MQTSRADRLSIGKFIEFYGKRLSVNFPGPEYPEDDPAVPADARIDALYKLPTGNLHLEHTSIDLIASGKAKKRSLDPGFLVLEKELAGIECPEGQGVNVLLSFEYARDIPRLKRIAPLLAAHIANYISETNPAEWSRYPRPSDVITVEDLEFQIRPDVLRRSRVSLQWAGSDVNFLDSATLEPTVVELLTPKISKLDRSLALSKVRGYAVLIVETNDVAAQSFHSLSGIFARAVAPLDTKLEEIWGLHGDSYPTLVWHSTSDRGRTDCPYCDDPDYRTYAQIESQRMREWISSRRRWFHNDEDSRY